MDINLLTTNPIDFEDKEYFDVLCIIVNSNNLNYAPKESDVHLFSYLSCLLSIYSGQRADDWGYSFVVGEDGYPFSAGIMKVIQFLRRSQLLVRPESEEDDMLRPSQAGCDHFDRLLAVPSLNGRRRFIDGATDAQLMVPVHKIIYAVQNDPAFGERRSTRGLQTVLDGPALARVHQQLQELHHEIGVEMNDLFVPATVWLQFFGYAKDRFQSENK